MGGTGGCRIVFGGIESLRVDLQAPMETPLCKNKEGKGVGEGLARGRSDAKVRLFLRRERCLNTQFFAYLPPWGWLCIYNVYCSQFEGCRDSLLLDKIFPAFIE